MASNLYNTIYNPDVLSCIANLSNDEVFTPPEVANAMLDLLPQELFSDPNITFLDPACKSGVFLREIAKRLLRGQIPDYEKLNKSVADKQRERKPLSQQEEAFVKKLPDVVDHIFKKQLFGIAITELTSHLSRRSLYCSKTANGNYSIAHFDTIDGNVRFKAIQHRWKDGKCVFCGVNKKEGTYEREGMEVHAYELIHTLHPERIFNMRFDVIIGNPPYQLNVGVQKENYAVPIYNRFVEQAMKLNPRFLTMIIPSRWFTGGRGLDDFRTSMLSDKRIRKIVDYVDSKDCFAGVDISGGVNYFLWDRDHKGDCEFVSIHDGKTTSCIRDLSEFSIFPRYNESLSIIHKIIESGITNLSETVSTQTPFGFITTYKGQDDPFPGCLSLLSSKGITYVSRESVSRNLQIVDKYKVIFSKATCEHAGTPDKNGQYRVISSNRIISPGEVCTQSYLVGNSFDNLVEAEHFLGYLRTKFFRFLLLQGLTSQDISRDKFIFVPNIDCSRAWTDEDLYDFFSLTQDEIDFVEAIIRPMDADGGAS